MWEALWILRGRYRPVEYMFNDMVNERDHGWFPDEFSIGEY